MKDDLKKIPKTLCLFAWNQMHVTPIGVVKPCCIFDGSLKNEDQKSIRVNDNEIEHIWNSEAFRDLRLKMLRGEEIPGCKKCYEEERVSNSSDRTRGLMSFNSYSQTIKDSQKSGIVNKLPNILNLKIGNKCNLKCRMCQPLDSGMVDDEFTAISKLEPRFRSFDNANAFDYNFDELPIKEIGNWISDDLAKNNLHKLLLATSKLSLAGGETTFTQEAIDILKFCVEKDIAKNISVDMSSNLTRITDDLIELMSKFKVFRVGASIDGLNSVGEYIRYPAKWNIVKSNLIKLINAPLNVIPVIAPTVQIYNVLNLVELFEFIESFQCEKWKTGDSLACHLTILFDPQHLSIRHLPRKIKGIALERLLKYKERSELLLNNKAFTEQFQLLLDTLEEDNFSVLNRISSTEYLSNFMQYTNDLDRQRNQRLQDFIPELYRLLENEKIVPRYPKDDPKNYTYYKYRDSGFRLYSENKVKEALEMFQNANQLYAADPDLLSSMGLCYKDLGDFVQSLFFFKEAEKYSPENGFILKELGVIYLNSDEINKALLYLDRALISAQGSDREYIIKLIAENNNKA